MIKGNALFGRMMRVRRRGRIVPMPAGRMKRTLRIGLMGHAVAGIAP